MVKMNGCAAIDSACPFRFLADKAAVAADFHLGNGACYHEKRRIASNARRYPLLITCQLRNALGKQCSCLYTRAILLGKCPKPLNVFREIDCAPAELNIAPSRKVSQGFFGSRHSGKSGFAAYPSIAILRR